MDWDGLGLIKFKQELDLKKKKQKNGRLDSMGFEPVSIKFKQR